MADRQSAIVQADFYWSNTVYLLTVNDLYTAILTI